MDPDPERPSPGCWTGESGPGPAGGDTGPVPGPPRPPGPCPGRPLPGIGRAAWLPPRFLVWPRGSGGGAGGPLTILQPRGLPRPGLPPAAARASPP